MTMSRPLMAPLTPARLLPSVFDTVCERLLFHAKLIGQITERHAAPFEFDKAGSAQISLLLFRGRPATIAGHVILRAINAVYRLIGGALTHVGKEVRETLPSLTNPDARSAVGLVSLMLRVRTSLLHRVPTSIGSGARLAMRSEVLPAIARARAIPPPAGCQSARGRVHRGSTGEAFSVRFHAATIQFASAKYNDGKRMRGLERRRAAEAAMYRGDE